MYTTIKSHIRSPATPTLKEGMVNNTNETAIQTDAKAIKIRCDSLIKSTKNKIKNLTDIIKQQPKWHTVCKMTNKLERKDSAKLIISKLL